MIGGYPSQAEGYAVTLGLAMVEGVLRHTLGSGLTPMGKIRNIGAMNSNL